MKILITGITGQDGAWLAEQLLYQGHEVYGTIRRGATPKTGRLEFLGILDKIQLLTCDLAEFNTVFDVLNKIKPEQIYNMAAQSFVAESFNNPLMTNKINYMGVLNILESIRVLGLDCSVYQASSSEMFGDVKVVPQNEDTNFYPMSPYGVSKSAAHHIMVNYRKAYGIHACNGILFNHESELRGKEFVTRKITSQLAELVNGRTTPIELGNLNAKRDWGYAPEYMSAVIAIMNHNVADDFVIATNQVASIRDFFNISAQTAGFEPEFIGEGLEESCIDKKTGRVLCVVNKDFYRPSDVVFLQGDNSKAKNELGWQNNVSYDALAAIMTEFDLKYYTDNKSIGF